MVSSFLNKVQITAIACSPAVAAVKIQSELQEEIKIQRDPEEKIPGDNLDQKDEYGYTALDLALLDGKIDCVRDLIHQGATVENTHLGVAVRSLISGYFNPSLVADRIDCIRFLAEQGADLDWKDSAGCTALHNAILIEDKWVPDAICAETVSVLVELGADVDVIDNAGDTPLILARKLWMDKCVEILTQQEIRQSACKQGLFALKMIEIGVPRYEYSGFLKIKEEKEVEQELEQLYQRERESDSDSESESDEESLSLEPEVFVVKRGDETDEKKEGTTGDVTEEKTETDENKPPRCCVIC